MAEFVKKDGTQFVVPGFPEIVTYQYRCRMCILAKEGAPGIARLIHDRKRNVDESLNKFSEYVYKLMCQNGLKPAARKSVFRHFERHVDFSEINAVVTAAFEFPDEVELGQSSEQDERALLELVQGEGALGKNESDYHHMYDMFQRLYRRIKAMDADPLAFLGEDGQVNGFKLSVWIKLVTEAGNLMSKLNKMRNDDRMVLDVLEGHTKRFSMCLAEALKSEIRHYVELLSNDANPAEVAEGLDGFMRKGIVTVFRNAAVDSLQQSRDEYNLN